MLTLTPLLINPVHNCEPYKLAIENSQSVLNWRGGRTARHFTRSIECACGSARAFLVRTYALCDRATMSTATYGGMHTSIRLVVGRLQRAEDRRLTKFRRRSGSGRGGRGQRHDQGRPCRRRLAQGHIPIGRYTLSLWLPLPLTKARRWV